MSDSSDVSYDPFSPNPFPAYAELRERCPVHHYPSFADGFYSLSRYDDVVGVFKDLDRYSADEGQGPLRIKEGGLRSDPPEHTVYRRLVTGAFTASRTAALEPYITEQATALVDAMAPRGFGDLIPDLAAPLPVSVISHILGIPLEQRDEFRRLSDQFMAAQATSDLEVLDAAKADIYAVFTAEIEARRKAVADAGGDRRAIPDDMLTSLILAERDGRLFSLDELHPLLLLLLVGGIETTTSLIGNLVHRLFQHDLWATTVGDDSRLATAIEESLRFDPPVLELFRTARDDMELHGVAIPAGAKVAGIFASANRDPEVWDRPEQFSLNRTAEQLRRHLSFGAGIWYCPGAALARLEATVAVRALARRLPGLRLAGPVTQQSAFLTWGPSRVPLVWDPVAG